MGTSKILREKIEKLQRDLATSSIVLKILLVLLVIALFALLVWSVLKPNEPSPLGPPETRASLSSPRNRTSTGIGLFNGSKVIVMAGGLIWKLRPALSAQFAYGPAAAYGRARYPVEQ